jgi:Tfp pilus assembly protein PilW
LVGAMIGLIVISGAMFLLMTMTRAQPKTSERAAQIQDGRTMVERITRELRQAEAVTTATATSIELVTGADPQNCGAAADGACRVTYACAAALCSRTIALPDGSGTPRTEQVVEGLRSASVFAYSPATNPSYVTVTLEFADRDGAETVTVSDGVAPRNWFDPGGAPQA